MDISSQVKSALKQAGEWLVEIRKEKGSWQDMVYKQQGILNTAEAWLSLRKIRSILDDLTWEKKWLKTDCQRVMEAIRAHGFVRSPYAPENQPHKSVDAAAFVQLWLGSRTGTGKPETSRATDSLAGSAVRFLIESQSPSGGWSWGVPRDGRPLYPYFTYMAIQALSVSGGRKAQRAVSTSMDWLIQTQNSDGSYPVHSGSSEPDIASTAYAAIALSETKHPNARAALRRATRYLLAASLSDVTHVGRLKIVEPDQPPQRQIDYENYAVAANVLLALIQARPHLKQTPPLDDRIQFWVQHLLQQQAPTGGWPGSYPTIYTTHTSVSALVTYQKAMQSLPPSERHPAREHFNPYVFGFPIQQRHLFFGRASIIERVRADLKTPPSVKRDLALIGERRIGKTSLLYQLPFHLQPDGHRVFYLDLELMQSTPQFLQTFITSLAGAVFDMPGKRNMKALLGKTLHHLDPKHFRALDVQLQTPFLKISTTRTEDLFVAFLADVGQLLDRFIKWRPSPDAKMVCLLDEIAYLQNFSSSALISLLRGLAQQTADLVFIVAGTPKACRILTSAASPFYNIFTPIHLGQLEPDAAIALMTQPVKGKIRYTPEAIDTLLHASKRQPYTLQVLCYHCIRWLPSSQNQVTENIVQKAIGEWQNQKDWK